MLQGRACVVEGRFPASSANSTRGLYYLVLQGRLCSRATLPYSSNVRKLLFLFGSLQQEGVPHRKLMLSNSFRRWSSNIYRTVNWHFLAGGQLTAGWLSYVLFTSGEAAAIVARGWPLLKAAICFSVPCQPLRARNERCSNLAFEWTPIPQLIGLH